jgi:hypothetical protein
MSISSTASTASGGSGSNHRRRSSKVKCVTVADVYDIAADIGSCVFPDNNK